MYTPDPLVVLGAGPDHIHQTSNGMFVAPQQDDLITLRSPGLDANFSVAMYVEAAAAMTELHEYRGQSAAELRAMRNENENDDEGSADPARLRSQPNPLFKFAISPFYSTLGSVQCNRAMRLVVTRPTPRADFYSSIGSRLGVALMAQPDARGREGELSRQFGRVLGEESGNCSRRRRRVVFNRENTVKICCGYVLAC